MFTDFVTLAMAAFTAWMAWETRTMSKITRQTFAAAQCPHLTLHAIHYTQGPIMDDHLNAGETGGQLTLSLKNPGNVKVLYDIAMVEFSIDGITGPSGPYDNHAGVIFPSDVHDFRLPAIVLSGPLRDGAKGAVRCRVRYWSAPNERFTLDFAVNILISSTIKWTYQSGPTYA